MATSSGMLSRVFVSGAFEATAGTAQTLSKSWDVTACSVDYMASDVPRDTITGFLNTVANDREQVSAGGSIDGYLRPDICAWMSKMCYNAAPSSALVSPSTTVYEHTFNTLATPPGTFTLVKSLAGLAGYTEKLCGNGITDLSIKSGSGKISISAKVEGMGANYAQGVSVPGVSINFDASEDPMIGTNSNLYLDDVVLTKGDFDTNWSIDISTGANKLSTGGSTDNSVTRFDYQKERMVKASFVVYQRDTTWLAAFLANAYHSFTFECIGHTIDIPNSLKSSIKFKLVRAKMVNEWKATLGDKGVFKIPIEVSGVIDTGTGFDITTVIRNLVASY